MWDSSFYILGELWALFHIQFGEGALVRLVHKRVQSSGGQTKSRKDQPNEKVVVLGEDQHEADHILGNGREHRMHYGVDAADPPSSFSRSAFTPFIWGMI